MTNVQALKVNLNWHVQDFNLYFHEERFLEMPEVSSLEFEVSEEYFSDDDF